MFGWLRRKQPERVQPEQKPTQPRKRTPKPFESKTIVNRHDESGETQESGEIIQPGKLILKHQITTQDGTERLYIQPLKLEIPNMVTIGGKLDTILEELSKKPDREWFQADYIETLKNVLKLANDAAPEAKTPETEKVARVIGMIQNEVSAALILETLKVKGPLSVTDLSKQTGVSRVTIWRDLKKLSKEGKVRVKREGKFKVVSLK